MPFVAARALRYISANHNGADEHAPIAAPARLSEYMLHRCNSDDQISAPGRNRIDEICVSNGDDFRPDVYDVRRRQRFRTKTIAQNSFALEMSLWLL